MKIVAVLHPDEKAQGFIDLDSAELAANPPLSLKGFQQALSIVQSVEALGPFDGMFTSRMSRALDTSSVLAMHLNMDFQTIAKLGQAGNKEGNKVVMYPGFEEYSYLGWQNDALSVLDGLELDGYTNILIVSHRPIIGGLLAFSKGITNEADIAHIVTGNLMHDSVFEFEYISGTLY